jgi:hypothetical protein
MPQVAAVSNANHGPLLPPSDVTHGLHLPLTDQSDALRRVGERLLIIAADTTVHLSDRGREDARRVGAEMLAQATARPSAR